MRSDHRTLSYVTILITLILTVSCLAKHLEFGDEAPEFYLKDQEGFAHTLSDHKGKFVLLFFYPRDFTPHTIRSLKMFEKMYKELKCKNTIIYGVSSDSIESHLNACEKLGLTFDLLSDPEQAIIDKYDAIRFLDNKFVTYLIGPDGKVFKKYEDGLSSKHALLALRDLP